MPCEFDLLGQTIIGLYPSIQLRHHLKAAELHALGFTNEDLRSGEPASLPMDNFALRMVYAAVVGSCWPGEAPWPSMKACRHDVTDFGVGVSDQLFAMFDADPKLPKALVAAGRELLQGMHAELAELRAEVATEAGFTESRGASSTSSSG